MKNLLALTAAIALSLSTAYAQVTDSNRIVPGQRIGAISLGMSRAQVMAALPYHRGVKQHTFGVEEIMFLYESGYDKRKSAVDVLLLKGNVVQIATSDQGHKVEGGYNIGTGMDQIKAKFSGLNPTNYYFTGDTYKIYDSVNTGIAFAVQDLGPRAKEMLGSFESPEFIVVHPKGRPTIAIWNKVRADTKAPPQKKPRALQRVQLTRAQKNSAMAALNSLRRLESAVSVGLSYANYSNRVVDTQVTVDEKLRSVPQSDLKSQLQSAMASYASARHGWKMQLDTDLELMQRMGERMMQGDWNRASQSLRNAGALIR